MVARAKQLAQDDRFYLEEMDGQDKVTIAGRIDPKDRSWQLEQVIIGDQNGQQTYAQLADIPDEVLREQVHELTENQGLRRVQFVGYIQAHGELPPLDWALIATFASIAGAGGLTNVLFSNYARDKGWGMGAKVGAIASAVGGRTVTLSHVGQTFRPTEDNMKRWRGWMRHIIRDQAYIWMICCFIGMALPCMMSIEYIRNAPISGDRVAAMSADGIEYRNSGYGLGFMTLLIGFLILYAGQIMTGDTLPRRWCDIIWTASSTARHMGIEKVKYIYYGLMAMIGLFGLVILILLEPLAILKMGGA